MCDVITDNILQFIGGGKHTVIKYPHCFLFNKTDFVLVEFFKAI